MPKLSRRQVLGASSSLLATLTLPVLPKAFGAAPMLGAHWPRHVRFKLGTFELTMISDSNTFIDGPWPLIGKNAEQNAVDALMRENLLPTNRYQPGFTPMVVNTGNKLILFDTGNGERGFVARPDGGWLAAQLEPAGFKPEQFDIVVLSHGHPDHIGGLMEAGSPLFPNAEIVIGAAEYDFWKSDNHAGDLKKFSQLFRDYVVPLAERIRFIQPGDPVAPGIEAIESYGHTPGHLSFGIDGGNGQRMIFLGDCAHHHVASLARPDWHCVFDVDAEKGALTRARMFDRLASEKVAVSAYHMPFPSIGYIERSGRSGYRWLPHSYQLEL